MFIHLNLKTCYSIMDSICRPEEAVKLADEYGMEYLAICDHNNMHYAFNFQNLCLKTNKETKERIYKVNPIFGVDFTIESMFDKSKYFNIKCYAYNEVGYKHLIKLSTYANTGNKPFPYLTWDNLFENKEGLILLTGGDEGELLYLSEKNDYDKIKQWLDNLIQHFSKDNLYVELTMHDVPQEKKFLHDAEIKKIINELELETVLTNNIHYLKEEHSYHRALAWEMDANPAGKEFRDKFTNWNNEFYFKSGEDMEALFEEYLHNYPNAITNTQIIARRCDGVRVPVEKAIPSFPLPKTTTSEKFFDDLCWKGFAQRFQKDKTNLIDLRNKTQEELQALESEYDLEKVYGHTLVDYIERLKYEMETIKFMGFLDYFLIVADYIQWGKDDKVYEHPEFYFPKEIYDWSKIPDYILKKDYKIYIGPGRGSGAGSLVAFCLKITETIDPLEYGLLFERK